jgi:hypothetical protein
MENSTDKRTVAERVRSYLFDEMDGGTFRVSDLKKELSLNDKDYTLARNIVKRLCDAGEADKAGYALGTYRIIDKKKNKINWNETEAKISALKLPGGLHNVARIRAGDMIAIAGFKNASKTGLAVEAVRLNLDAFVIHFFISEYKGRMKARLESFGIPLNHPNLSCYPIDQGDYLPDKIESGEGVLNVIDHIPNLDKFYLVGKVQDEIHRALNGAICIATHQKNGPQDLDAVGKSFWRITPVLCVSLFHEENSAEVFNTKMQIIKAKEPAKGSDVTGMSLKYRIQDGCRFTYDPTGWKKVY